MPDMAMHTYMPRPPGADEAGLGDQHTYLDYIVRQLSQKSNRTKKNPLSKYAGKQFASLTQPGLSEKWKLRKHGQTRTFFPSRFGCGILSQQ